ncbi:endonuclease/exonuclease/phosphatase family protein [Nocardioides euryhalodurans]|uniref:Endonuclease/exonuclease/phosphatase domain-containing protein n=1 Tax=Nocardioides euryhalodurans TaxID=2518370 RepID=A0A4P7GJM4_9ACTN|nr:endonuclease/exonuclease/phosphatase family protein [Nocardioides euryhalodurans]QBR91944.1 hypothetical protein EXE57_06380 [Nocardioides euryhalodurans]
MSSPRHQGPRRRALGALVALGVVGALLLTFAAVMTLDQLVPVARDTGTVATEPPAPAAGQRDREPTRAGARTTPVVGKDPAHARMVRAREEKAEAARLARLAAERAEERRQQAAAARREALEQQREEREARQAAMNAPVDVRIGTFNVLGSQHTDADGPRDKFPPASVRTARAAGLVAKHGVDVLGTQELQDDQLRDLQSRTGMAAYPGFAWGEKETDNSILWDPGVYEMVSGSQFTITFVDRPRPQPIVKLRHLATGREIYVVNTHPSPGGGRYLTQRRNAQATLVSVVKDLRATGLPVMVTGDMNDRAEFYCRVVPAASMSAPNGGSYGAGCQPPPEPMPVDWVVGGGVASWSGYWRDTSPVENRTSDHFFVSATARLQ